MMHPEQREGEIFVGNVTQQTFSESNWKTKRLGHNAYDQNGRPVAPLPYHQVYPMFVSQQEYDSRPRRFA